MKSNTFSRLSWVHSELERNLAFVPADAFTSRVVLYPGMVQRVAALRAERERLLANLERLEKSMS